MANELMLRLLLDGKIVGYELICGGVHRQSNEILDIDEYYTLEGDEEYTIWDSFELGVQFNGTYVFEGDILTYAGWKSPGVVHRDDLGMWVIRIKGFSDHPLVQLSADWYVVGNIHEEHGDE